MQKRLIPLFILFFIGLFCIFSYILFPVVALRKKIESEFSQMFPGQLMVRDLSLEFPPCLSFKKIHMTIDKSARAKKIDLDIDEIRATINPLKILLGKIELDTDILFANGIINLKINRKWIGTPVNSLVAKAENVLLEKLTILKEQYGMGLSGTLGANLKIEFSGNELTQSQGNWSFNVENGHVMPPRFPPFHYNSCSGKGFISEQKIFVEDVEIQGEEMLLLGKGEIKMGKTIAALDVDLKVQLKIYPKLQRKLGGFSGFLPKPDKQGYINLNLYGPPQNIRFRFSS